MQIVVDKKKSTVILRIHGHLNADTATEFERVLNQQLDGGELNFVLNLAELTVINSAGLCSILAIAKKVNERNGSIAICALQGAARKVFEISGFAALFAMYPTEVMALNRTDAKKWP